MLSRAYPGLGPAQVRDMTLREIWAYVTAAAGDGPDDVDEWFDG